MAVSFCETLAHLAELSPDRLREEGPRRGELFLNDQQVRTPLGCVVLQGSLLSAPQKLSGF
jgi:hypothetical protein